MPTTWNVLGASVLGAAHSRSKKPNQDAIKWVPVSPAPGAPLVLAVADGHGSERFFRSADGALFAVEVTLQELQHFAQECQNLTEPPQLEKQIKSLPGSIVHQWRARVKEHWRQHTFTAEESRWLQDEKNKSV